MKITVDGVPASELHTLRNSGGRKNNKNSVRLRRRDSRGNRPETPLLTWKITDDGDDEKAAGESGRRNNKPPVSTRKLAAGLWRMRPLQVQSGGRRRRRRTDGGDRAESSTAISQLYSVSGSKKHAVDHHRSSSSSTTAAAAAVVSALGAELDQAKARINKLETQRRSSRKKLEQFLQKLNDEKAAWRSREQSKARAIIEDVKTDLTRERKNRRRLEMINSELLNELADLKSSAKQYLQQYEKERKAREIAEEVCDELAKEIGEEKDEVEALQRESMNAREEVEEERKMLQMAEVWREERVQMKLVDAKVLLEEKYSEMNRLIAELESFLRTKSRIADSEEIKRAQFLKQVAASINMDEIRDLKYEPPNPREIFSVFEEDVNNGGGTTHGTGESEEEPSTGYSHYSKIHGVVSPQVKMLDRDGAKRKSDRHHADQNGGGDMEDDTSEWETVSQLEDQGSTTYSPFGSDYSSVAKGIRFCNGSSVEINPARMKGSSSVEGGRAASNGAKLPTAETGSTKDCFSPNDVTRQWSSPLFHNPHINRAKGCIEWPLSIQKNNSKAKLMEARVENHKVQQLRQVLKLKT